MESRHRIYKLVQPTQKHTGMKTAEIKTPKERNDLDLLELVCQLHSRALAYPTEEMHKSYVEARNELERRLGNYAAQFQQPALPSENFIPVIAIEDGDGHWHIIPKHAAQAFDTDLQDEKLVESGEFDNRWGKYRTGGDLNLTQLFIKNPPTTDNKQEKI